MLNTIKNIIKEKKVFQEAAEIILEDEAIDDSIILGDDDSYPEEDAEDEKKDDEKPVEEPIEEPKEEPTEEPATDPMDEPVEDPTTPGETLPEPVAAQTGEPAEAGDDIILSTEIDLNTNTSTDTLPTPPVNAGDVVEDDVDTTKVDAGFGGDEEEEHPTDDDSFLDTPIDDEGSDEPAEESTITEAISVGEEPAAEENAEEEKPADDTANTEEDKTEEPADEQPVEEPAEEEPKEEDNPVTAAVKDKVAEMNTEDDVPSNDDNKEALFKKLSSLTKGIEDVKASLLKY